MALLPKARRSAILRQARRELELERASAAEPTASGHASSGRRGRSARRPGSDVDASPAGAAGAPDVAAVAVSPLGLVGLGVIAVGALAVLGASHAAVEVQARALSWEQLSQAPASGPGASPVRPGAGRRPRAAGVRRARARARSGRARAHAGRRGGPAAPAGPRADAHVNRDGYGHIPGGVVFVPSTFSSADGSYDLYLHFHGNTRVVLESAEYAGLNAIVAVVNLGVNSAPYLDAYEMPGTYERTLAAVARALGERGLVGARLHRVAIGSWSGGYGAVSRILERESSLETLDAVLVLDGIHCGFLDENPKALNTRIISPFLAGAKRAAEGKMLFSITHSEIDPGTYAGTNLTASYLLDAVHGTRGEPQAAPEHVQLHAAEGAVARRLEKRMEPTSEATVGSFHVRGYRGNTPEHHMAHLLQMGATVMPELAQRWR